MTALLRPAALAAGDTLAVLTLSSPGPVRYPNAYARGIANLKAAGFRTVTTPTTTGRAGWTSGTPRQRAEDLNAAFADPAIGGIVTTIGGNHSAQLLPYLDWETIAANPKVFCGYSDTTVLHHAIRHMTGMVTFYGPAVIPQWGEHGHPFPYTTSHFHTVTRSATAPGPVPVSRYLVHEDHHTAQAARRARSTRPAPPRLALRPGRAHGPLAPFCPPSMRLLAGTPWQPDLSGHILLLDISDHAYGPEDFDADLTHLRQTGLIRDPAAVVMLRTPTGQDATVYADVLLTHTCGGSYPVLIGMEGGHVDPMPTYPLGVAATLDTTTLTITEPAVIPRKDRTDGI
ncbi:LD-carboxypeptidase [Streptomyces goshikiensis]|uniref:LD-carboxypeptidase n=1 Tax=Streptomyces TaxID=1883 RepID=UPI00131DF392|nr:LD-carboxypeptidase [Streptomyces sp. CB02120-2]